MEIKIPQYFITIVSAFAQSRSFSPVSNKTMKQRRHRYVLLSIIIDSIWFGYECAYEYASRTPHTKRMHFHRGKRIYAPVSSFCLIFPQSEKRESIKKWEKSVSDLPDVANSFALALQMRQQIPVPLRSMASKTRYKVIDRSKTTQMTKCVLKAGFSVPVFLMFTAASLSS